VRYLAAAVQLTSTGDVQASLDAAEFWVRAAAERGAKLVALPEAVSFMGPETEKIRIAEDLEGPSLRRMAGWAERYRVVLSAGSIPERTDDPQRTHNTSVLFGPDGSRLAVYRKIHLFEAEVGDGRSYHESEWTRPGDRAVLADTPLGRMGLSVCYDLRFPGLYRAYGKAGCDVVFVPSAFTVPTGVLHWEVLLRARAVENQCFVVASAQGGVHHPKRRTYGHAMIVDPSGLVLAEQGDRPGLALAEIDLDVRADWAQRLPTARHTFPFEGP
jgi:predicted amidohydrolase